jgi:hypothetical protein
VIRVLTDHPGTRIGKAEVNGNRVSIEMLHEPMTRADWTTHDYNVHFCVGLENAANERCEVDLSIQNGAWDALPDIVPALYSAAAPDGPYAPAPLAARSDLGKRYCIRVPLDGGEKRYVANTMVRVPAALAETFDALGREGGADRRVIGRTLEGRDIVAYVYGDPDTRGTLLVSSGFHPPEPDTLASAEIMRHLAGPEGAGLLDEVAIAVVPLANPDGYANGTQGSNAAGINFYWHFARELPERCPEAAALWRFADALAPRGYIDFHCYTFQLRKKPGPYQRPPFFHDDRRVRAACRSLYARLAPGVPVTGFSAYAPHTLGAMLTARYDTLSLAKYHLHLAEGEEGCRERGRRVFLAMASTLKEHGLTAPATPRGWNWRSPLRNALIVWAGLLRPSLGWLRRGRFERIDMTRTRLVPGTESGDTTA